MQRVVGIIHQVSFITLSFWIKSSVAQTYYCYIEMPDGTEQHYPFEQALTADTWTKVTSLNPRRIVSTV